MRIIQQKTAKNAKRYKASRKDVSWHQDPKGYFLLRLSAGRRGHIEVAFCTNNHVITKIFSGKHPVHLYYKIAKTVKGLRPEHYAYLGKELHKAYFCMAHHVSYVQDGEVNFNLQKRKAGQCRD